MLNPRPYRSASHYQKDQYENIGSLCLFNRPGFNGVGSTASAATATRAGQFTISYGVGLSGRLAEQSGR